MIVIKTNSVKERVVPSRRAPRNTRQRQLVLEELRKVYSHPTAVGVYDLVRRRLPKISLGTIYRNLELLAQLGMIQKIQTAGAETRFDANPRPHDHVRCVRCGRVDDLPGAPLDRSGAKVHDSGGYQILGCRLEFFGICPRCRKAPAVDDHCEPPRAED
jgi:Fur family ferric uptake transcriptional regulator